MWIWLPALAWSFLLLFWGRFWRGDQRLAPAPDPSVWPEVVVVIPARDEAATIEEVVKAHRLTDYPRAVPCIVADDSSSDGTGELARGAGAEVVTAPPLTPGWSGKLWALKAGLARAREIAPGAEWVLLTDADILHAPGTLRALVATGEAESLSLVSLMARLDSRGVWGGLLIPAFVFFFQKLYPFPWVNRPRHWCAAAAGGCVLARATALDAIGGLEAMRDALIDDCTLGARVKHTPPGRKIWLGLADEEVISLRDNRPFGSVWNMVARTAFTQLHHSVLLLAGTMAGMGLLYALPVGLVAAGTLSGHVAPIVAGGSAWGLMVLAYAPTLRLYGQPVWRGGLLPAAGLLYAAMTVASSVRHWRGSGGRWKGRSYP